MSLLSTSPYRFIFPGRKIFHNVLPQQGRDEVDASWGEFDDFLVCHAIKKKQVRSLVHLAGEAHKNYLFASVYYLSRPHH